MRGVLFHGFGYLNSAILLLHNAGQHVMRFCKTGQKEFSNGGQKQAGHPRCAPTIDSPSCHLCLNAFALMSFTHGSFYLFKQPLKLLVIRRVRQGLPHSIARRIIPAKMVIDLGKVI
jgi:hypothetical protein